MALAMFAAAMWFAWLGWDHQFYKVDGVKQGPYRAWQVVGCALAIGAATVFAYLRVSRSAAIVVMAAAADIGFAVPWAVDASSDESGLWIVGLVFLLVGGGAGLAVVLVTADALANPRSSPLPALVTCGALTLLTLLFAPMVALIPAVGSALVFFYKWLPARRRGSHEGSS